LSSDAKRDPYHLAGITLEGKYHLEASAGIGGLGAVYRASEVQSGQQVAVKVIKPDILVNHPDYADIFAREIEAVRRLDHPHIVKLLDSGADGDVSYMVMEWLEGRTLEEVVSEGQLAVDRIIHIFKQICDAFDAAHAANIIHLDVKPANIILLSGTQPADFIKVIDFGMARLLTRESGTTATRFLGTYQYCSPEHFGGKVSHSSDVYSLGVTLYHIITGTLPFGTSYINAKIHPNLELPPIPSVRGIRPEFPRAVDGVIKKALSRYPKRRQRSARELFEEFSMAVEAGAIQRGGAVRRSPSGALQLSTARAWFLGVLIALVVGSVGGTFFYLRVGKSENANNSGNNNVQQEIALLPSPTAVGLDPAYQSTPTSNPGLNSASPTPQPQQAASRPSPMTVELSTIVQPTPAHAPNPDSANPAPRAQVSSGNGTGAPSEAANQLTDAAKPTPTNDQTGQPPQAPDKTLRSRSGGGRPVTFLTNQLGDGQAYRCYLSSEDADYIYYECYVTGD
jgi:serine/threonine protein kinase